MWHLKVLCYIRDTVSALAWQYCINQKFTDKFLFFFFFFFFWCFGVFFN